MTNAYDLIPISRRRLTRCRQSPHTSRWTAALLVGLAVAPPTTGNPPVWTLKEQARIDGTSQLASNQFVRVSALAVSRAGNVFVLVPEQPEIRVFDSTGQFLS